MDKRLHNELTAGKILLLCMGTGILMGSAALATAGALVGKDHESLKSLNSFKQLEISGVTLAMSLETITENLTQQGYETVNSRLFTKRGPLQNNRTTVFRIEIEDDADSRMITYHRSLTGGRVKTAGDAEPIVEYEIDMAQQFYTIMCGDVSDEIWEERQCEPLTEVSINAGYGQFVEVSDRVSMQLNVTAANSAVGIKYRY